MSFFLSNQHLNNLLHLLIEHGMNGKGNTLSVVNTDAPVGLINIY